MTLRKPLPSVELVRVRCANLDLASIDPELDIYDTQWPIWTYQHQLPPAKFIRDEYRNNGVVANTLVSGGSIVSGSHISDSVLFSSVQVQSFCQIEQGRRTAHVAIGYTPLRAHRIGRGADHRRDAGPAVVRCHGRNTPAAHASATSQSE